MDDWDWVSNFGDCWACDNPDSFLKQDRKT